MRESRIVVTGHVWAIIVLTCFVTVTDPCESQELPRTRQWLTSYVLQPLPHSSRNDRYLAFINRYTTNYCDVDETWFLNTTDAETFTSRRRTNEVARLAFCYHTRGTPYYRDPTALAKLKTVCAGIVSHVNATGCFTWEKRLNKHGYKSQPHEHAWRLEPLLLAYLWVRDDLSPHERSETEDALRRAAKWLNDNPNTETNNRGVVWAAVLTMAGVYFEEPAWLEHVEQHAPEILRHIIHEDGEIGENTEQYAGGGPDANYTYTSLSYIYMYHLWSGNSEIDPRLRTAMRWLAGYTTKSGWPVVVGASVRTGNVNQRNISDCLPYFERFSKDECYYAELADSILSKLEQENDPPWGHVVSPFIWGMLEAGDEIQHASAPAWHANRLSLHSRPNVHYALVGRRYQTGVTFRARRGSYEMGKPNYRDIPTNGMPLRGLQAWAWDREYPLVLHTRNGANGGFSFTEVDGINTAQQDISRHSETGAWEVDLKMRHLPDWGMDLATIVTRQESLWTVYAFTPCSTTVAYGGPRGSYRTSWYMNPRYLAGCSLDTSRRLIRIQQREGQLHYWRGEATAFADRVEIAAPVGPIAFGFSDASYRFTGHKSPADIVSFSDASGDYALDLKHVLREGNIDRGAPLRLSRTSAQTPR